MSGSEPFLSAIRQSPDDDAPRLIYIYADWLDENGEPERAEFIRVQIELARNKSAALHEREQELSKSLFGEFVSGCERRGFGFTFDRGFFHRFSCRVRFGNVSRPEVSRRQLKELIELPVEDERMIVETFTFEPDGKLDWRIAAVSSEVPDHLIFENLRSLGRGKYHLLGLAEGTGFHFRIESRRHGDGEYQATLSGSKLEWRMMLNGIEVEKGVHLFSPLPPLTVSRRRS